MQEETAKIRLLLYVISRWLQVKTTTEGALGARNIRERDKDCLLISFFFDE